MGVALVVAKSLSKPVLAGNFAAYDLNSTLLPHRRDRRLFYRSGAFDGNVPRSSLHSRR